MSFPKVMKLAAGLSSAVTVLFIVIHKATDSSATLSAAITFGTFAYHFLMRLLVGRFSVLLPDSFSDYNNKYFKQKKFEKELYQRLKVKKWKAFVPTYYPEAFSLELHSPEKIAKVMCGAELCHTIIAVLSFIPLLFAIPFGAFPVFLITSVLACCVDLIFITVQRYNRPRIIRLISLKNKHKN